MRKIIIVLLFLSIVKIGISQNIYINVEKENLRRTPNGKKIGTLLKGVELKKIEKDGKWTKVRIEGWIYTSSTSQRKPIIKQSKETISKTKKYKPKRKYRVTMWYTEMHSGPSPKYEIIGYCRKGEKVEVFRTRGLTYKDITVPWHWVRKRNGKEGWICDADFYPE